jgi:hypothetical protein
MHLTGRVVFIVLWAEWKHTQTPVIITRSMTGIIDEFANVLLAQEGEELNDAATGSLVPAWE